MAKPMTMGEKIKQGIEQQHARETRQRESDLDTLTAAIESGCASAMEIGAFEDMHERMEADPRSTLSDKQREWASKVLER